MKTIKVKIIKKSKPNFWYELGKTYEVQNKVVKWNDDGIPHFQVGNGIGSILCSDCEILNLNETPEYVELTKERYGLNVGTVLKVLNYSNPKSIECTTNIKCRNYNLWLEHWNVKPSTKEAYEKQNAIPEKTMQELIDELGYEFKIKK
jgi:hypothetical protein